MPPPATLVDAIEAFLAQVQQRYSPRTGIAYSQALHLFRQVIWQELGIRLSNMPLEQLDPEWVKLFLAHLQATRSIETEHLYTRAVLNFYQEAERRGWAPINTDSLSAYLTANRRQKKHIVPEPPLYIIERVLSCVQATPLPPKDESTYRKRLQLLRDKAFLPMLAQTGLRVSEICDLRRHQVNYEAKSLWLTPSFSLPLASATVQAIKQYLKEREPLDATQTLGSVDDLPLFARHDKRAGKRVLPISRWTGLNIIEEWVIQALSAEERQRLAEQGQTITPHTFRHYFVYTTLQQTGDLSLTQIMARHIDPATTRRYLHHLVDRQES